MLTKVLEAKAIIKKTPIEIFNTEMDIFIDWDIKIKQEEHRAYISFDVKFIKGFFTYKIDFVNYNVSYNVKFNAIPDEWTFEWICDSKNINCLQPETIIIDFDKLNIKITY